MSTEELKRTCEYWARGRCRYTEAECKGAHKWTDRFEERYVPTGPARRSDRHLHPGAKAKVEKQANQPSTSSIPMPKPVTAFAGGQRYGPLGLQTIASKPLPSEPLVPFTTSNSFSARAPIGLGPRPLMPVPGSAGSSYQSSLAGYTTSGTVPGIAEPPMQRGFSTNRGQRLNPKAANFTPMSTPKPSHERNLAKTQGVKLHAVAPLHTAQPARNVDYIPADALRTISAVFESTSIDLRHISRAMRDINAIPDEGARDTRSIESKLSQFAADLERLANVHEECKDFIHELLKD